MLCFHPIYNIYTSFELYFIFKMKMVSMKNPCVLVFLCHLAFISSVTSTGNCSSGTIDGSETWGYVEVRPGMCLALLG